MTRLKPVSRRKLVRRLKELGFEGPFSGGRHSFMSRDDIDVHIPNPHASDISISLLLQILKQAGISKEEWSDQ